MEIYSSQMNDLQILLQFFRNVIRNTSLFTGLTRDRGKFKLRHLRFGTYHYLDQKRKKAKEIFR